MFPRKEDPPAIRKAGIKINDVMYLNYINEDLATRPYGITG